jgi:hypothetical protein
MSNRPSAGLNHRRKTKAVAAEAESEMSNKAVQLIDFITPFLSAPSRAYLRQKFQSTQIDMSVNTDGVYRLITRA